MQKYNNNPANKTDVNHKTGFCPIEMHTPNWFNNNAVIKLDIILNEKAFNIVPTKQRIKLKTITGVNRVYFFFIKSTTFIEFLNVKNNKKPAIIKNPSTEL